MTELKDHVIIQEQNDDQIYNEEDVLNIPAEETVDEEVSHLVDGEVRNINFCYPISTPISIFTFHINN